MREQAFRKAVFAVAQLSGPVNPKFDYLHHIARNADAGLRTVNPNSRSA